MLSRTRWWKVAAPVAAGAPIVATAGIAIENPHDRVWYAFSMVGVLIASTFLSTHCGRRRRVRDRNDRRGRGRRSRVAGVAAANAEEAVRLHEEHRATIRLILSDVLLPGESGPQIARPDLPLLYMSGYAANELEGLGTARLLTKPFSSAQLIEAVNAALR